MPGRFRQVNLISVESAYGSGQVLLPHSVHPIRKSTERCQPPPPGSSAAFLSAASSSPVRLLRDKGFQSNLRGLYPCGEGAGYAGGIVSAAVDGLRVAEAVAIPQKHKKTDPPADGSEGSVPYSAYQNGLEQPMAGEEVRGHLGGLLPSSSTR